MTEAHKYRNKAARSLNQGQFQEVLEWADKALQVDGVEAHECALALQIKGQALHSLNRKEEAIKCYDQAVQADPQYAPPLHNKGETLRVLKRNEEAIECYDQALRIQPDYVDVWYLKGLALKNLNRNEESIECLEQAVKLDPTHASAFYNIGRAYFNLKEKEKAIAYYDKALQLDPKLSMALHYKGRALSNLGKKEEALACYVCATEINPQFATAFYRKGLVLTGFKRYAEALEAFHNAIQSDSSFAKDIERSLKEGVLDVPAFIHQGDVMANINQPDKAAKYYDSASKLDNSDVTILVKKGVALYSSKAYKQSLQCFEEVLLRKPGSIDAVNNKGNVLQKLEKYEEAKSCYDTALALSSMQGNSYTDIWNNQGNALCHLGRLEEAVRCFDEALKSDPENPYILYNKGRALYDMGQESFARESFGKAVQHEPILAHSPYTSENSGEVVNLNRKGD